MDGNLRRGQCLLCTDDFLSHSQRVVDAILSSADEEDENETLQRSRYS